MIQEGTRESFFSTQDFLLVLRGIFGFDSLLIWFLSVKEDG